MPSYPQPATLVAALMWIERFGCEDDKAVAADGLRRFDADDGGGFITRLKADPEQMAVLEDHAPERKGWQFIAW